MQHESAAGSRAKSSRLKHWRWKWPRNMQLFNFNRSWNTFRVRLTSRTATGCCNANISRFKPLSCTQATSSMSRWCKSYVFHAIQNDDLLEIHLTSSNLTLLVGQHQLINTTDTLTTAVNKDHYYYGKSTTTSHTDSKPIVFMSQSSDKLFRRHNPLTVHECGFLYIYFFFVFLVWECVRGKCSWITEGLLG